MQYRVISEDSEKSRNFNCVACICLMFLVHPSCVCVMLDLATFHSVVHIRMLCLKVAVSPHMAQGRHKCLANAHIVQA